MFALYSKGKKPNAWVFNREVNIAGSLAAAIASRADAVKPKREEAMPWDLTGTQLRTAVMAKFGVEGVPADSKLIIDATWGREDALLLGIENVFGYSYPAWTPLMLQLEEVAEVKQRPHGARTAIDKFYYEEVHSQDYVHEFLYLQCGHLEGRRSWGLMGYTNAALLWPDAFSHLLSRAGFVRPGRAAGVGTR